jgi:hypothetical protein
LIRILWWEPILDGRFTLHVLDVGKFQLLTGAYPFGISFAL